MRRGTALPLTRQTLRPEAASSRERIRTSSPAATSPASSRKPHSRPPPWKNPSTRAPGAPARIIPASARPPMSRPTASMTMDLPAPVSPVSTFRPGPNAIRAWSITARLEMSSSISTVEVYGPASTLRRKLRAHRLGGDHAGPGHHALELVTHLGFLDSRLLGPYTHGACPGNLPSGMEHGEGEQTLDEPGGG